ncbi:hypothetical protein KIL84_008943 [Mauremys mutica]|uniref:Uncharacterized protein n=1 Tax=Mauremys mutica TaxID=74926 RepID=A0A9D3XI32_9SAUR|nr:hypothetical protein KIL84_008943 [Mauremys mutica]
MYTVLLRTAQPSHNPVATAREAFVRLAGAVSAKREIQNYETYRPSLPAPWASIVRLQKINACTLQGKFSFGLLPFKISVYPLVQRPQLPIEHTKNTHNRKK